MDENNSQIDFRNKVILAPMVRVGTLPMRLLALKFGAQLVYTEEIIDYKLIRCKRVVNQVLGTIDYIDDDAIVVFRTCSQEKSKVILQLGTSDATRALSAAKLVEQDVSGIDVNMGCPKLFSLKGGMGAALLTQPQKVKDILTNLVNNIRKPITCKIRVLPRIEDTLELVKLIESTGVRAIAVHGRTKEERPQNPNRNEVIRAIAQSVSIPVIANGGSSHINTNSDIELFRCETSASSVMIARAAQKNCSIFVKQDFLLPIDDVIKEYLKFAIDFENNVINTKYCIQQMLGPLQETDRGKALLAAQQMKIICQLWQMHDYYSEKERLKSKVTQKLLNSNQTNDSEQSFSVKRRKIFDKKVEHVEMPVIFVRNLFGENDLPKSLLMSWTQKKSIKNPEYRTTQIEKHFNTIVTVDGKCYSSCYLEKSKKYSEQNSALVALISLDLINNYDIIKESLVKNVNHIEITTPSHTFYIKTS